MIYSCVTSVGPVVCRDIEYQSEADNNTDLPLIAILQVNKWEKRQLEQLFYTDLKDPCMFCHVIAINLILLNNAHHLI